MAVLSGCMASAEPPLDVASASAFAAVPMRRLETHSLEIYYPAARHGLALRVAARLEYCVGELRRRAVIHNGYADRKLVVLMPEAPINNAYVLPPTISLGSFAVVPTYSTLDLIGELDLAFDPGRVGCHEAVHYVHALQVAGVWRWINTIFGDVLTPQIGLDVWFWEGLATYYESELQPGTGRMHSPAWRGMFHAAYAGRNISGSDLDFEQRPFHWGNHYLVGSHFIEFLVRRYGESKLWSTIARQGRTVFFPFLVSLEFRSAYGKTLSGLLDEFASDVATSLPPRVRPAEQHWVRDAGEDARYAVAPDGTEALIAASGDDPIRLRIYDARGRLQRERLLTDVLPFGALSSPDVRMLTGLSFTADARELYFVAVDRGAVQLEARLVRYRLATDELEIVANDLPGSGGGVAPDGRSYYFSQEGGDRADVAVLDLESGRRKLLSRAPPGTYYLGPRPSPDGQRLVAAAAGAGRSHVVVFSARGGAPKAALPSSAGPSADPWFFDAGRVVFLGTEQGRFQVYLADLASAQVARITDAPYLAMSPRPRAGAVRFLNREGVSWSIDEVPLAVRSLVERTPAPPPSQPALALPDAGVLADEPYSAFDHLFVPNLRAFALVGPEDEGDLFGLTLSGSDRLQFQRWALTGLIDPKSRQLSGSAEYVNRQLAPFTLRASLSQLSWHEDQLAVSDDLARRVREGRLSIGRAFGNAELELGATGTDDRRDELSLTLTPGPDPIFVAEPTPVHRRLAGPFIGAGYAGFERTPYAGLRRGFWLRASATLYPAELSSLETFADVRARTGVVTPLPLSRRHTLDLSLRARALVGLTPGSGLLEVGGKGSLTSLVSDSNRPEPPEFDAPALPPGVSFAEPLRGFEDYSLALERVGIAELTYEYPIVIDHGASSLLWLLPSWFIRQLNFDLFAAGAADAVERDRAHVALGGSLTLSTRFSLLPLQFRYQVARRLTDDEALVQSFWLALNIEAQRFR